MALTNAKIRKAFEEQAEREIKAGKLSPRMEKFLYARLQGNGPGERPAKVVNSDSVTSKRRLMVALGVDNKTFYTYLAMHGAPVAREGKWSVSNFREHMLRNGYNTHGGKGSHSLAPEQGEEKLSPNDPRVLRAEAARMKIAREQRELDILDRVYIPRSEVNEWIAVCNSVVMRNLEKALVHELPPLLEGMTAAEISERIMAKLGEVLAHLPEALKDAK